MDVLSYLMGKKAGGGGSTESRFVVTFAKDPDTEELITDKTFAECVAAWNEGKTLFASDNGDSFISLSFVAMDGADVGYIAFYQADPETPCMYGFGISADGAEYYST